jgi:hypothetical protein
MQGLFNSIGTRWQQHKSLWVTGEGFVLYMGDCVQRTEVRRDRAVLIPLDSDRPRLHMTVVGLGMEVGVLTSLSLQTSVFGKFMLWTV